MDKTNSNIATDFEIGQKVLVKNFKKNSSTDPIYIGPYCIIDTKLSSNMILIEDDNKKYWENLRNVKIFHERSGII